MRRGVWEILPEYDLNIFFLLSSGHMWHFQTHIHLQCNLNSVQPNYSQQRLIAMPVTSPAKWLKQTSSWREITMPKNKHVNHYVFNSIPPLHIWRSNVWDHFEYLGFKIPFQSGKSCDSEKCKTKKRQVKWVGNSSSSSLIK